MGWDQELAAHRQVPVTLPAIGLADIDVLAEAREAGHRSWRRSEANCSGDDESAPKGQRQPDRLSRQACISESEILSLRRSSRAFAYGRPRLRFSQK